MAISFKTDKDHGYSLLPLFGVSITLIDTAKAAGVLVEQSSPGTFVVKSAEMVFGSVPVKGSAISLAKSKTLGPASKEALKFQFEAALNKAIKASMIALKVPEDGNETPDPKPATAVPKFPTATKFNPLSGMAFKPKPPASGKFSKFNPVPLSEAKDLYTPVTGTTGGSVYFVLAMFPGMNVAARVSGLKLSIRAEGSKLKDYHDALDDFGIDHKSGYSSGHYEVGDNGLMIKSLGALIGRLGFAKATAMADIEMFIGGQ